MRADIFFSVDSLSGKNISVCIFLMQIRNAVDYTARKPRDRSGPKSQAMANSQPCRVVPAAGTLRARHDVPGGHAHVMPVSFAGAVRVLLDTNRLSSDTVPTNCSVNIGLWITMHKHKRLPCQGELSWSWHVIRSQPRGCHSFGRGHIDKHRQCRRRWWKHYQQHNPHPRT